MKMIIDGKRYDTDTAELIHKWNNGYNYSDFDYCREELFKTKKGTYFIVGSGGARSKYSTSAGNTSWGGHGIEIVSDNQAIGWLEDHGGTDALEKEFGDTIEDA